MKSSLSCTGCIGDSSIDQLMRAHLALLLEDAKWMTLEVHHQLFNALARKHQSLLEDSLD